jgi:TfoX/Sxy family transcriptional regulator of competence genes
MAYDEQLEVRIADVLEHDGIAFVRKYMFGGVAFMVRGHMTVGIVKDDLMVRVGPEENEAALEEDHTRPMDFAGKPSKGLIYVDAAGTKTIAGLSKWVRRATAYVATQPIKKVSSKKTTPPESSAEPKPSGPPTKASAKKTTKRR